MSPIKRLAVVDRGQAVNLARNLLDDPAAYTKLTPKGIYRLVEAVLQMDKALLEIDSSYPKLIAALRVIAKPALGGKMQQHAAQEMLREIGENR